MHSDIADIHVANAIFLLFTNATTFYIKEKILARAIAAYKRSLSFMSRGGGAKASVTIHTLH